MPPQLAVAALLLLLLQPRLPASSTELSEEDQILRLLNLTNGGYNKGARPRPDNGSANVVDVMVTLVKVINVDMVKQTIDLENTVSFSWTDPRLAWHKIAPPELTAVRNIHAPMDLVWTPDMAVNEPVELRTNNIGTAMIVEIQSTGRVTVRQSFGTTTKCNMQMANFPFDKQECNYTMASRMKPQSLLQLRVFQSGAIAYSIFFLRSNEYCITSIKSMLRHAFADFYQVAVIVSLKRLPLYYVTVLIVPSALILATCIFGFLLPADSGDRLALNVAILLSMSVFLQLAGSITPAQSESVPVLTWYFMVAMTVTTLSTVGSIIVHLCYRRAASGEAVSNRALRLLFLNRLCGWKTTVENFETCKDEAPKPPSGSVAMVTMKINPESEWRQIGCSIDRLLISCCVGCSALLVVFIVAAAVRNESIPCPAQCEY